MIKFFLFITFCFFFANAIVVFEGYTNEKCITEIYPSSRKFMPLKDRIVGLDPKVQTIYYSTTTTPPEGFGVFLETTDTQVVFNDMINKKNITWPVHLESNKTACHYTPMYGYGRFFNVSSPVMMTLINWNKPYDSVMCNVGIDILYPFVAYSTPVRNSNLACPTQAFGNVALWDGGSTFTFFDANAAAWLGTQVCKTGNFPGESCAKNGMVYCVYNRDCYTPPLPHPNTFPFNVPTTYANKIVTTNEAGVNSTGVTSSSASFKENIFFTLSLLYIIILFVI